MTQRKETLRNLLNLIIIACVIILFGLLGGFVSGMLNLGETAGIIIRTAGLLLLISLGMKLVSQYCMKSLAQAMKEEEIREAEQKDEKQLLFKPTIRVTWWKTIRNLSDLGIIVSVPTLFVILLLLVFGLKNLGDKITMTILCIAGVMLLISLGMDRVYQYYSEEIREAEQIEEKQLLFKPSWGISVIFVFFIAMPVISIISQFTDNKDDFGLTIAITGVGVLFAWMWYTVPVFTFAEDSVQITSHLLYLLGIDRKTVIRYADITSVGPNHKIKANMWGVEPKHSIVISMNGTTQECGLGWFNSDMIAKIYLRFKEKLGDKVTLQ